jgi:hypothetical protein
MLRIHGTGGLLAIRRRALYCASHEKKATHYGRYHRRVAALISPLSLKIPGIASSRFNSGVEEKGAWFQMSLNDSRVRTLCTLSVSPDNEVQMERTTSLVNGGLNYERWALSGAKKRTRC